MFHTSSVVDQSFQPERVLYRYSHHRALEYARFSKTVQTSYDLDASMGCYPPSKERISVAIKVFREARKILGYV
jgi:hypothetical protein